MVLNRAALVLLLAGLAGCTGRNVPPLPNPELVAAHEWEHGPPWGPEEVPWVPPPETYATYDPWAWSGSTIGFGIRRGHWWGGHRGHARGGFIGRGGFHRGFPGGFHGGGRRGRR